MAKSASARTDFFMPPFEMRLVWPHLATKKTKDHEGKELPLDKQYYDATLLIPKTTADPAQCRNYQALMQRINEVLQTQFGGQWPANAAQHGWPIKDCDTDAAQLEKNPFTRGHWKISPWSSFQPRCVDPSNNDIPVSMDGTLLGLKSGDYVYASINAWGWPDNKGISLGLEGVKKTREGEAVGTTQRSVQQMFGGAAPAAMAPPLPGSAPAVYHAPAAAFVPQPAPGYAPGFQTPPNAGGSPMSGGYPPGVQPASVPQMGYVAPQQPPSIPGAYPSSVPPGNPVAAPAYGAPTAPYGAPPFGTR